MVQNNQQLLSSFILHIPVAIAILAREMHYLAVSDRFVDDYQQLEQPHLTKLRLKA